MAKIYPSYEALRGPWTRDNASFAVCLWGDKKKCLSDECLLTSWANERLIVAWKYLSAGKRFACQMPQPEQEPGSTAHSEPDVTRRIEPLGEGFSWDLFTTVLWSATPAATDLPRQFDNQKINKNSAAPNLFW